MQSEQKENQEVCCGLWSGCSTNGCNWAAGHLIKMNVKLCLLWVTATTFLIPNNGQSPAAAQLLIWLKAWKTITHKKNVILKQHRFRQLPGIVFNTLRPKIPIKFSSSATDAELYWNYCLKNFIFKRHATLGLVEQMFTPLVKFRNKRTTVTNFPLHNCRLILKRCQVWLIHLLPATGRQQFIMFRQILWKLEIWGGIQGL